MTAEEIKKWHQILEVMALNWGLELTKPHYTLYDHLLEKYTLRELESAATALMSDPDQARMPNLNAFEKCLQGDARSRSNRALERLTYAMSAVGSYESVVFEDQALMATVDHFGGWPQICQRWNEADQKSIGYLEHDFRNVYQGMLKRDVKVKYLPGQFEIHNANHRAGFERGILPEVKVKLIPNEGFQRLALLEDLGEPKLISGESQQ